MYLSQKVLFRSKFPAKRWEVRHFSTSWLRLTEVIQMDISRNILRVLFVGWRYLLFSYSGLLSLVLILGDTIYSRQTLSFIHSAVSPLTQHTHTSQACFLTKIFYPIRFLSLTLTKEEKKHLPWQWWVCLKISSLFTGNLSFILLARKWRIHLLAFQRQIWRLTVRFLHLKHRFIEIC